MLKIKNIKITPEQLDEIQHHLQIAAHILNQDSVPDWEDINTACHNIYDAKLNLQIIRDNAEREAGAYATI